MTLDSLKEDYKKTFSEPRLSGKFLPEDYQKLYFDKIDAAKTLDEFVSAITTEGSEGRNTERFILMRILKWNDEPPVDKDGKRITNKTNINQ